ncbi:hypothetical protein PHPALM_30447 [Phytophthora palmivora]|uniref:Uncharacterized protein n=1 Tax=Phytophthora palmivora TaxID=4796 RepID=A0A2P4X555_9STRA|nr:hypothetical protein PHPALM_30447 [Phytophthora palmivora]
MNKILKRHLESVALRDAWTSIIVFKTDEHALYHLVKYKALEQENQNENSIRTMGLENCFTNRVRIGVLLATVGDRLDRIIAVLGSVIPLFQM